MRQLFVALSLLTCVACGSTSARVPLERAEAPTTVAVPTVPPPTLAAPPVPPSTVAAPPAVVAAASAVLTPRGFALPVEARQAGGWTVQTPCGNKGVISNATPVTPAPTVIIDPGHGGGETGAVGPNRLREAVVNMAVSTQAANVLKANGVNVLLTRPGDERVVLTTRSELVQKLKPAAFVSVHHNSDPDGPRETPGSETYYQYRSTPSKRLAGLLYEEIFRALSQYKLTWVGDTDAGAKYRLNDRGGDYYHVLRETAGVPSALAELAFMSNPAEADLLARPDVQQVEGDAVARAILRFLRTSDPGSGFTTPYPRTTPTSGGGAENCVDPPL